ncbi:unnamed protein product [Lactuca saligna]|uniref:Uncharacterized protein n=1 Tax=Lactuca saligna TaxID=75948 RepID=A0AA35ZX53_LACSI|nr:unnamed protein product [Lactuca saligna]
MASYLQNYEFCHRSGFTFDLYSANHSSFVVLKGFFGCFRVLIVAINDIDFINQWELLAPTTEVFDCSYCIILLVIPYSQNQFVGLIGKKPWD